MEIQLQELIDRIKSEGVAAAKTEAAEIIEAAKAEAERIVADAKAQSDKILSDAKTENERMTRSGEDAIRQAGRNLLISFRESVAKELDAILGEKVDAAYSKENLEKIIVNVIESWANKPDAEDLTVIIGGKELGELENSILAALKERISKGVTLGASDGFDGGFRIAAGESGAYYDFSADSVVDMMSGYLNPKIVALMKEAE